MGDIKEDLKKGNESDEEFHTGEGLACALPLSQREGDETFNGGLLEGLPVALKEAFGSKLRGSLVERILTHDGVDHRHNLYLNLIEMPT